MSCYILLHLRCRHHDRMDHRRRHRVVGRGKPPTPGPHASTFCDCTYESDCDCDGGVEMLAAQRVAAMTMTALMAALVSAEGGRGTDDGGGDDLSGGGDALH